MSRRRIADRTCRQLGSLKGRERRELTADHPLKQIYERRMNSIQRAVQRGSLDETLAEGMKRLAKDKLFRAISSNDYARDAYPAEMEQDSDVYRWRDGRPVPYGVVRADRKPAASVRRQPAAVFSDLLVFFVLACCPLLRGGALMCAATALFGRFSRRDTRRRNRRRSEGPGPARRWACRLRWQT